MHGLLTQLRGHDVPFVKALVPFIDRKVFGWSAVRDLMKVAGVYDEFWFNHWRGFRSVQDTSIELNKMISKKFEGMSPEDVVAFLKLHGE